MSHKSMWSSIRAGMGAVVMSGFVTSIAGVMPFGLAYTLPDSIWRNVAFIISGIICVVFFIGLSIHAYGVELELMFPTERGEEEWDDHET